MSWSNDCHGSGVMLQASPDWALSAESELRRLIRERDREIAELRREVERLDRELAVASGRIKGFRQLAG